MPEDWYISHQTSVISLQMCLTVALLIRCAWEPGYRFFPFVEPMPQSGQQSIFLFCKDWCLLWFNLLSLFYSKNIFHVRVLDFKCFWSFFAFASEWLQNLSLSIYLDNKSGSLCPVIHKKSGKRRLQIWYDISCIIYHFSS